MKNIEQVTETNDGLHDGDKTYKHPAFAQIGVGRSSGGHSSLYGSDFDHRSRMTIRICASSLRRSLATDWHFERETHIEVELSEAQWATFVASPNNGSGVPCTLTYLTGEQIPSIPAPQTRTKQFAGEMNEAITKAMSDLDDAVAFVDTLGLSAKRASELKAKILSGGNRLRGHAPFLAERFDTHMEETVEKAKSEVHGYMTGQIMRAGLTALGGDADALAPLSLTYETENRDATP